MAASIYRKNLKVMCDGPFVGDWEFSTLMGVTRNDLLSLYEHWEEPPTNETLSVVRDVLLNLLYYPHGRVPKVEEMMGQKIQKLSIAFENVPGLDLH